MSQNLIQNPNLDGPYSQASFPEGILSQHWQPVWKERSSVPQEQHQGPTARPEYKKLVGAQFPYRVQNGTSSQCFFVFHRTMDAGVMQVVQQGIQPGQFYQLSMNVQAWCSNRDDPRVSEREMYISLGLNPWGQADLVGDRGAGQWTPGTVWTPWAYVGAEFQVLETPPIMAMADSLVVCLRGWNKWKSKHADVILDHASLVHVAIGDQDPPIDPPGPVDGCKLDMAAFRAMFRQELERARPELTWPD